MEEKDLTCIARFIHERTGLSFAGHKKRLLRLRLEERLIQLGISDLGAYAKRIVSDESEQTHVLELLTTNETSFFRNPRQFEYLMGRLIPALEEEKGKKVMCSWGESPTVSTSSSLKMRILCAGCSTGEEPYSVAMALLETLRYPRAWDIEILAGDLSESCIRAARKGFYEAEKLKGLPDNFREKFTDYIPGGINIKPDVKKLIRFSVINLNDIIQGADFPGLSTGFTGFDMIFCRNVLIYFSLASQQHLVDLLYRSLAHGGYLFTGDVEPLHLYTHNFTAVRDAGCLIYRKMETVADANNG